MNLFDFRERDVCLYSFGYGLFSGLLLWVNVLFAFPSILFAVLALVMHRGLPLKGWDLPSDENQSPE